MKVGVWIDHRRARLVSLESGQETTRTIDSGVGKHVRLAGGARSVTPWGPQDVASDPNRDRKFEQDLSRYYDRVVDSLKGAEEIFLCGPGLAKTELKKKLDESGALAGRVTGFEAQDKMTDRQLAAKVRAFFGEELTARRS